MDFDLSRRKVVGGGFVLGLLALAGCQRKPRWEPLSRSELDGPPHVRIPPSRRPRPTPMEPETSSLSGIMPRREWTSSPPNLSLINPMNGVNRITVHHDGMDPIALRTKWDAASRLEQIRRAHINHDPPWADIGYHYIVDPQGRVWEGRPVQYQGAHVKDNNEHNLGIMVLGNFDEQRPTSEALSTLDALIADRMRAYRIPLSRVLTHQEINPTRCPGRSLQSYMLDTRSRSGRLTAAL
jgi:hypothetical protein